MLLLGCGGPSAMQLCRDSAGARCGKLFECYTSAERTSFGLTGTESDCTKLGQDACSPAADGGSSASQCEAPKSYDTEAAGECLEQFKAVTCEAVRAGSFPASCNRVCR
jgi:hypothetical protein